MSTLADNIYDNWWFYNYYNWYITVILDSTFTIYLIGVMPVLTSSFTFDLLLDMILIELTFLHNASTTMSPLISSRIMIFKVFVME